MDMLEAATQSALVPWIVKVVEIVPRPAPDAIVVPFMNQMARSPLVSRQRISLLPSPLKSPVSATAHTVDRFPTDELFGFKIVVPLISQIAKSPLVSSQRMSDIPSPLKSPTPTTDQLVDRLPRPEEFGFKIVVPFISQIEMSPAVSRHRM